MKQYKNVRNFRNFFTPKLEQNSFVSTALLSWGPPAKQKGGSLHKGQSNKKVANRELNTAIVTPVRDVIRFASKFFRALVYKYL